MIRGTIDILPDRHAAARAGAESFVERARAAVRENGGFSVALSGGSTPREMYALLASEPFRARVPWPDVHLFWGDERCVPPAHPRSNYGMAYDAFIAHVPIPPENVHRMRGELPPARAAEEYEAELTAHFGAGVPRFDLVHLGLGDDAHTASLFPFDLGVLTERERRVRSTLYRPLGEHRLTLTVPVLNAAARVEFLVLGGGKAPVVRSVVHGALDPFRLPAQLVRPAREAPVWLLDACAAADVEGLHASAGPAAAPSAPRAGDPAAASLAADAQRLGRAEHADPFRVLGMHERPGSGLVVRAFLPDARMAAVLPEDGGAAVAMRRLAQTDLFEADFPASSDRFAYRLRVEYADGATREIDDPYRFGSTLSDFDLHLLGEGTDLRMYDKLGAHPCVLDGVRGTRFAVWAPNAARVSVVGDFNRWDGRRNPMRLHPGAGVWEVFLPDVHAGALYKYEIKPRHGAPFLKSDPLAFRAELRPGTASVVYERGSYAWGDGEWMAEREAQSLDRPFSVYEAHLGSWRRGEGDRLLSYRELAHELGDYVAEMGFTHVELMPIAEHPYDPSWGYQVTGYFAPTSRYGAPDDLRYLVDHLHQRGIGVLLDWVPAHFPKDAAALRRFDGTALYEHEDPRRGEHPDWGTMIFNYGRNEVRNFLIANALFWLEEYHIDGLRVDAVASMLYLDYSREHGEWVPNPYGGRENLEAIDFLHRLNAAVHEHAPGALMIAEESTAWPGVTQPVQLGGLGFDLKWNMGWMNDFLRFIEADPIHRQYHFGLLTFSLMYAFSERFVLPLSHDEVVHGKGSLLAKMPGDDWQKFANLRLALGFMWSHPGKKLLFMGGEIGQWTEWSEARSLDWHLLEYPLHAGLQRWVRDLNALYRREPALWSCDFAPEGFAWIDFHDAENSVVSFRRVAPGGAEVVCVFNFTPVPRHDYRVGVPRGGWYRELLNSDAAIYGGSNLGNAGGVESARVPEHGHEHSLRLTLPPLGVLVLKGEG